MRILLIILFFFLSTNLDSPNRPSLSINKLYALEKPGDELKEIGAYPELGSKIDVNAKFINASGKEITINDYLVNGKPLLLVPAYFSCPSLCGLVHKGISTLINNLKLSLNKDYNVLTYSFDPTEGFELAKAKQENFRKTLKIEEEKREGWDFVVSNKEVISKLNSELSFFYKKDKEDFAHTAVAYIITPSGVISQYFTGITFPSFDVKLALLEAAKGNIGSAFDRVLLYCFRFDPTKGKYTWAAFGIMRAGGVLTLILLVWLMVVLWKNDKKRNS